MYNVSGPLPAHTLIHCCTEYLWTIDMLVIFKQQLREREEEMRRLVLRIAGIGAETAAEDRANEYLDSFTEKEGYPFGVLGRAVAETEEAGKRMAEALLGIKEGCRNAGR